MAKSIDDGNKKRKVDIRKKKDGYVIIIDEFPYLIEKAQMLPDGRIEFTIDGNTHRAVVVREGNDSHVLFDGQTFKLKDVDEQLIKSQEDLDSSLNAPMPGRITKILVNEGDIVKPKQQLLILEAMKMEHIISAPYAGTVEKIFFKVNDQVKDGQNLIKLDPIDKMDK
ncbi:MAG: acetyl-CoA carboxylase biotin carboxyl carrier protein subunit [Candidatus Thorarchaeota archaeon]